MRVLINAGSPGSGGYATYLRGILRPGRVSLGDEVFVFATRELAEELGPLDESVRVVNQQEGWTGMKLLSPFGNDKEYASVVEETDPDVILETTGFLWGRFRVPSVVVLQNLLFSQWEEFRRYLLTSRAPMMALLRIKANWSVLKASGVVYLSSFSRDRAVACYPELAHKPSTIVPHGLDSLFLSHQKAQKVHNGRINIIYTSPIYPYKHQWHVVAGVAMLRERVKRDIRLTFLGGGEPRSLARLLQAIRDYRAEDYVRILPPVPQERLVGLYSDYDIFLFASSCESFGLTLLEGMASGMPIACSDRSGLKDILGECGSYFDPEDPVSIATALEPLCEITVAGELSMKARKRAEGYSWETSVSQLYSFLKTCTSGR